MTLETSSGTGAAGGLLQAARSATRNALATGFLEPLSTDRCTISSDALEASVHVLRGWRSRDRASRAQTATRVNPFLPYDPQMLVAELSDTHVCLLNRFPIFPHHLLVVTRAFEDQESLLTRADFAALWRAVSQVAGLAFYNGGPVAGASQPHKHLQLVPDLGDFARQFPLLSRISALAHAGADGSAMTPTAKDDVSGAGRPPASLPYCHALAPIAAFDGADPVDVSGKLLSLYLELREKVGVSDRDPYNLLLTRDWMLVVPRSVDRFEAVEINSLGFAGSFFVRRDETLEILRRGGVAPVLRAVTLRAIT